MQVAAQNCRKRKQRYLEVLVEQLSSLKKKRGVAEQQHILLLREQQLWLLRLEVISRRLAAQIAPSTGRLADPEGVLFPESHLATDRDRTFVFKAQPPAEVEKTLVFEAQTPANEERALVFKPQPPANEERALVFNNHDLADKKQPSVIKTEQPAYEGQRLSHEIQKLTSREQAWDSQNQQLTSFETPDSVQLAYPNRKGVIVKRLPSMQHVASNINWQQTEYES